MFLTLFLLPLSLRIIKSAGLTAPDFAVIIMCLFAVAGAAAYLRWRAVRLFLAFSVILPVIGLLSFVLRIPLATDDAEAAQIHVPSRTPVVLVVLDEFPISSLLTRGGEIDEIRYPSFARLARGSTWYRNATTVHQGTTAAVPAILTGRMPRKGALPLLSDHPDNLFTLLGASYVLHVHEETTHLCPQRLCPRSTGSLVKRFDSLLADVGVAYLHSILPDSMAGSLPSIDDRWGRFVQQGRLLTARNQADLDDVFGAYIYPPDDELERFLSTLSSSHPGVLHFTHILLPHSPWKFLPSGREYGFSDSIEGFDFHTDVWDDNAWLVQQGFQRHLLQVQYTDAIIGRLTERLEQSGLYDQALMVVVADHGVSFRPGGHRRGVDRENIEDIAGVPLFVKYPFQQRGVVDLRGARTIDIVPTISRVLGFRLPWKVDGRPLTAPATRRHRVAVQRQDGTLVRASLADVARGIKATVQMKVTLFGEGRKSLYRIGNNLRLGI